MRKNLFSCKILSLFSLLLFLGICVFISETNFSETIDLVASIFSFVFLILSIIFFIIHRKTKPKTAKQQAFVDDNILTARKIYKQTIKQSVVKLINIYLLIYAVLMLSFIIYYIINFDKTTLIILSSLTVLMGAVLAVSVYFPCKHFFFQYQEFVLNGESIVMFTSNKVVWSHFSQPCLHVVYNGTEHLEYDRETWSGGRAGNLLDDVLFSSLMDLISWFGDAKFSNFIKVKIQTKNSGTVWCVYKLGKRQFIVSDKLEKLDGCFETSRSTFKSKRKKKTKKNSEN